MSASASMIVVVENKVNHSRIVASGGQGGFQTSPTHLAPQLKGPTPIADTASISACSPKNRKPNNGRPKPKEDAPTSAGGPKPKHKTLSGALPVQGPYASIDASHTRGNCPAHGAFNRSEHLEIVVTKDQTRKVHRSADADIACVRDVFNSIGVPSTPISDMTTAQKKYSKSSSGAFVTFRVYFPPNQHLHVLFCGGDDVAGRIHSHGMGFNTKGHLAHKGAI